MFESPPPISQVDDFIASYRENPAGALEGRKATDLKGLIAQFEKDARFSIRETAKAFSYPQLNRWYHRVAGVAIVAFIIIGVVTFFLTASNHLMSLPQDFLHAVTHMNYTHLAIGGGVALVWVGGAAFVIYRAMHKKEHLLELRSWHVQRYNDWTEPREGYEEEDITRLNYLPLSGHTFRKGDKVILPAPHRGAFFNVADHLETVILEEDGSDICTWVDKSTLDENLSGMAFGYQPKDCFNHYFVATEVGIFVTPFYMIGTMAYNAIRTAVIPFYILVCMALEAVLESPEGEKDKSPLTGDRKFTFWDIPEQMFLSIRRVIQAPFYALAYFFGLVLAQFLPMAGRKLASAIERDWNDGISLAEGLWLTEGRRMLWKFEGGGKPSQLGRKSLYITGCYFPQYFFQYREGKIVAAYGIVKAENGIGRVYPATPLSELEEFYAAYGFLKSQKTAD